MENGKRKMKEQSAFDKDWRKQLTENVKRTTIDPTIRTNQPMTDRIEELFEKRYEFAAAYSPDQKVISLKVLRQLIADLIPSDEEIDKKYPWSFKEQRSPQDDSTAHKREGAKWLRSCILGENNQS